jgi:SAM-dependent methyltransferase
VVLGGVERTAHSVGVHARPYTHDIRWTGSEIHTEARFKAYKTFMKFNPGDRVLDVGEISPMTKKLKAYFSFEVESTASGIDLNFTFEAPSKGYDAALCLEVIEHIMNPAFVMSEIYKRLLPGGTLYLSTPLLGTWGILHDGTHFTEYKEKNLEILAEYTGFRVGKRKAYPLFPWWWSFTGVRPMVRNLIHRCVVYEFIKPE